MISAFLLAAVLCTPDARLTPTFRWQIDPTTIDAVEVAWREADSVYWNTPLRLPVERIVDEDDGSVRLFSPGRDLDFPIQRALPAFLSGHLIDVAVRGVKGSQHGYWSTVRQLCVPPVKVLP